ncbi:acyl-CoA-binding domain-containing protein 5A-like isoform X1 [Scleropages formosus]|uniref:acyl-CoA-binding domain-containing protein 5A-like isoform X1 n=1 Tax=Scleropages formosus TaxID=113540 RepID=UPI0010FAA54A|nr:acyl-CoA-binding domain-containing protein 5A-like isoform X1 [Scleropages formosus]
MAEGNSVHECRFDAALKVWRNLPDDGPVQLSDDLKLRFYGFFKQATTGPCNIPKPGFWVSEQNAKWEAWSSLGDMSKEEAMMAYVEEMKTILESLPITDEVEELLDVLGPFYEVEEEEAMPDDESFPKATKGSDGILGDEERNGNVASSDTDFESDISESEEEEDDEEEGDDEQQEEKKAEEGYVCTAEDTTTGLSSDHRAPFSVSSASSRAHSSLDGENMEEELTRIAPAQEDNLCVHCEDASGAFHLTSDSDSEVYCDSIEHFGTVLDSVEFFNQPLQLTGETQCPPESSAELSRVEKMVVVKGLQEGDRGNGEMRRNRSQSDRFSTGEEESIPARRRGSMLSGSSSQSEAQLGLRSPGRDGDHRGKEGRAVGGVDKQIATVLLRLEEDMQHILQKLHNLETLSEEQARSIAAVQNYPTFPRHKDTTRWPFDISLCTVVFAVAWPFIVHWLLQMYHHRRSRKLS